MIHLLFNGYRIIISKRTLYTVLCTFDDKLMASNDGNCPHLMVNFDDSNLTIENLNILLVTDSLLRTD